MHESISSQVPVHITRHRSNTIQRKPKHVILRTIPTVHSHDLSLFHAQLFDQPVANTRDALEELAVRPRFVLEDEEGVVRLTLCLFFENLNIISMTYYNGCTARSVEQTW